MSEKDFKLYTQCSPEVDRFISPLRGSSKVFSRFKDSRLKRGVFASMSYSRLKENVANCIVQTVIQNFVVVDVFLETSLNTVAVVREFRSVVPLKVSSSFEQEFFFELGSLGSFFEMSAADLAYKCVVIEESQNVFLASVVSEGFQHN